ncbi:MAG: vanadium-dependent haloperoxidase, partial [Gemmatimonadetes bacterium]|nr:vanadium-dependent haloperoxidase [Gemmatimonadota bacterium]
AQHRALSAAPGARGAPGPDARATAVLASAAVLKRFFPDRVDDIDRRAAEDVARAYPGAALPEEAGAAEAAAREIARGLIAGAEAGERSAAWAGTVPEGPGRWVSNTRQPAPVRPGWGRVHPWFLAAGDELRPPPPPAYLSPEFAVALAQVRTASAGASGRRLRNVEYWADGPGTATPPGHWNAVAAGLARRYGLGERETAHLLAVLNAGLMDAGIACWDAKYAYWLLRPSQADTAVHPRVRLPNFPSYPSGHAYFSGAAAEILGHYFPAERHRLRAWAGQAALSRVDGGLHYPFDSSVGLEYGRAVGRKVLEGERRSPERLLAAGE